jgi:hypothetical protein
MALLAVGILFCLNSLFYLREKGDAMFCLPADPEGRNGDQVPIKMERCSIRSVSHF